MLQVESRHMKARVLLGVLLLAAFAKAQEVGTTIGAANTLVPQSMSRASGP